MTQQVRSRGEKSRGDLAEIVVRVAFDRRTIGFKITEKQSAETWLYDLSEDSWSQIATATLPFGCGMNYNMEYDPHHKVLLLVTGSYGTSTTVRALRIDLKAIKDPPAAPK